MSTTLRSLRLLRPAQATSVRTFYTTALARTQAGYGDPQDEKINNDTPLPASTPDPKPKGQGKGPGTKTGTTDPETKVKKGKSGNAGGKEGAAKGSGKGVSGQEIKETKKVGEKPKDEKVGGAGPIGG